MAKMDGMRFPKGITVPLRLHVCEEEEFLVWEMGDAGTEPHTLDVVLQSHYAIMTS